MKTIPLPPDSKTYTELAFREKEKLRRKRARMSLTKKLEVLEMRKQIPKIGNKPASVHNIS